MGKRIYYVVFSDVSQTKPSTQVELNDGGRKPSGNAISQTTKTKGKMEAEKKLQQAVAMLEKSQATDKDPAVKNAIELIFEFYVANSVPAKAAGKVSIWDYVSKDPNFPSLRGIHYDVEDKVAVATDTCKLLVVKSLYREWSDELRNNQGQFTISKDGERVDGRFPNWRSVFPKGDQLKPLECISLREAEKMLTFAKAHKKQHPGAGNYVFRLAEDIFVLEGILKSMLQLPYWKFQYMTADRPIVYHDSDIDALFMPSRLENKDKDKEVAEGVFAL